MLKKHAQFFISLCLTLFVGTFHNLTSVASQPAPAAAPASAPLANKPHVSARLIATTAKVQPGHPFLLGVELTMSDGWHTYYKDSGQAGMPTKITWSLPPGSSVGSIRWPAPQRMNDAGIVTYGYTGHVVLFSQVMPPHEINSKWFTARASVKWLECKDICIPGEAVLSMSLPVASVTDANAAANPQNPDQLSSRYGFVSTIPSRVHDFRPTGFFNNKLGLVTALLFALIGGFLLNLMPCVLPVISIKVMNLVNDAHGSQQAALRNGVSFSAGIIGSFEILALIIVAMQAAGQGVGWGFQFQYPEFSIAMAAIILVLALSLFGLFYIDVSSAATAASGIDRLASKDSAVAAFLNGVLATILATPCTAPFLGTAMGFAFIEPWWIILTIFFAVGLGMSAPYLLLSVNPRWMRYIPKSGEWMETFKQAMAFVLLGTVVWLLYVLSGQIGTEGVLSTLAFLLVVAFAVWLMGRLIDLKSSVTRKYIVWLLSGGLVFASYWIILNPVLKHARVQQISAATSESGLIKWQPFSDDALNEALQSKKTVLLDFTADWCLTCKVNEKTVLDSAPVVDKLRALKIVPLKADWTNRNPEITQLLQKFGRFGVPLYVVFPAARPNEPIVLPEVITQGIMLEALSKAGPSLQ